LKFVHVDHTFGFIEADYGVLVRPTLPEWSEGGQDQITLRMLDTDNIRVISSILGQSIALDHYAKRVDEMVNTFSELNRGMEKTGTFTMTRKSLFQLVAAANTTLADVILRLGLLERSDAAWKDANYAQIWEYLRDDFELDERFESLDFKLNIIQVCLLFLPTSMTRSLRSAPQSKECQTGQRIQYISCMRSRIVFVVTMFRPNSQCLSD
jgi:uncharacterized Rmd1/YagE family protein